MVGLVSKKRPPVGWSIHERTEPQRQKPSAITIVSRLSSDAEPTEITVAGTVFVDHNRPHVLSTE
jgi:hypothetical protein